MFKRMKCLRYGRIMIFLFMAMIFLPGLSQAGPAPARYVVVLDPGHGGSDKGVKLTDEVFEKDISLQLALALQKDLQANGNIRVVLTRTSDIARTTSERTGMARSYGAHAFISLHINASFGKQARGYEVYFPGFGAVSSKNKGTSAILSDMTANKYLNESVALAQAILRDLQSAFPREGRGLREAPMPIFESLPLPAVVVEVGFATNPEDRKMLTSEKGRQKIVWALSKGIKGYFRIK